MGAPKGHPPYNTKGEGGRPKWKWTDENIDKLIEMLEEALEDAIENNKAFWWKEFGFKHNLMPNQFAEFATKNKRFAAAYNKAKSIQEWIVVKGALSKKFADNFSQFYLKTQHRENWTDPDKAKVIDEHVKEIVAAIESKKVVAPE